MPTLRQLNYLVAVDDERHFGRAAKRVNVAQPTLSAQIAQLELRLGTKLLERSRSGVSPTPIGSEIIERARKVMTQVQEIVDLAQHMENPLAGRLRLGVPPTLGPYLLPHIIPGLHSRFPSLKLFVREGKPRDIQDQLLQGELDLALSPLPLRHSGIQSAEIFREKLMIATAHDHPLARHTEISARELKGQKVLTLGIGNHLYNKVREICDLFGAQLLHDYEGTSLDTLRHMVGMNVGISFFPALYVLSEIKDRSEVKLISLKGDVPERQIGLIWRRDSSLEPQFKELASLFSEVGQKILKST